MKKFFRAALVLPLVLFAASCSESNDDGGGDDKPVKLSPETKQEQQVYADNEQAPAPIKFTATAPWTATVAEVATKAEAGSEVDWLKLSAYSGGKGDISLTMTLSPNYSGQDRKAEIRIACGGTIITVTVEQKGTTESGEVPEDPEKPEQKPIELNGETPTQQTVYADETQTPKYIAFKALASWTATISEVATKAEADHVDWLELSAYTGSAGEVSLTTSLLPNYTGQDRKAEIRIVCGETAVVITVEQKATKADGTLPEDPNKPEQPDLKNRIVRIDDELDGKPYEYYEFKYDETGRVARIKRFQYGDGNYKDTEENMTVTYGDKTIVYEIVSKEGNYNWTCTDTAVLDENGRVISDKYSGVEEYEGETHPYEISYRFAYDADGYLVKTEELDENPNFNAVYQTTWTDGNPTKVIWTYDNKTTTDRATYGTIENKANLDLNWLIALGRIEGWRFTVGDNLFPAATGYMGKRSKYMAETVTGTGEYDSGSYTNKYQFDSEGRIVKITSKDDTGETDIYTIHYAE